jgi:predicted phage-related endonuclease
MSLTPEELAERQAGIFATDAAPALGLSKYRSPVQVWMEKIGEPMPETEQSERMKMGHILQPVIGRLYEERNDTRLKDLTGVTLWSKAHPFMGSHFDFVTEDNRTLVECKNFHPARMKEFGDDGSDDIPMDCLVQVVHECVVFGVTRADLAVLFGGQTFRVYPITVSPDTVDMICAREEKFWRQVVERVAPEPIDPEETRRLFPRDSGETKIAPAEIITIAQQLSQLKDNMKAADELKGQLEAKIQAAMGEASTLATPAGTKLATWKLSKDGRRVDTDALKAAGLYEQFSKETAGSRRFLLKV